MAFMKKFAFFIIYYAVYYIVYSVKSFNNILTAILIAISKHQLSSCKFFDG